MANLIVGESLCRIPKILDIIRNSGYLSLFRSNWQEFAKRLGVPEKSILELKNDLKWKVINLEGLLSELLYTWKGNCGDDAKLSVLCQALTDCHAKDIADKLEAEFDEILKAHFLATSQVRQGQLIKMSNIFSTTDFPSGIAKRFRRNFDPIQILKKLGIHAQKFSLGEFIQYLIDQLDEQEIKILEGFSFKRLFPPNLAEIMNAECDYDESKARKLVELEKDCFLWFVAARGVLKARLNEQQRKQILAYVFECEEDKEEKKESDVTILPNKKSYKFKHELLVKFMDWLMGNGYELPSNFQLDWLDQYDDACFNYENLAKHLFNASNARPCVLHRLIKHTMGLQASELKKRVNLVLNVIRENPGSVNSLNQDNLPPLLMDKIHVELIDLLIYAGANELAINEQGCNFVHFAASCLPPEQFQQLVRYLVKHSLTYLLNATDSKQWTPLFYLIQYNAKIDPSTLQVVAAAGADFNVADNDLDTPLMYAVRNAKKGCNVKVVKCLLENNANVNATNKKGESALFYAQKLEQKKIYKLLISKGARPLCKPKRILRKKRVQLRF